MKVDVTTAGGTALSVAVMPNVKVPPAVGVPDNKPVLLRDRLAGKVDPVATVQVSVPVPPLAVNCRPGES